MERNDAAANLSDRVRRVVDASDTWVKQLLNVGGQNRLLFYRHFKASTLALGGPDAADFDAAGVARLLGGEQVRHEDLFSTADAIEDAKKRCRTLHDRALAAREERGLETLFLAQGLATWQNPRGDAVPNAPVLLAPLEVKPTGAGALDFRLKVIGEWEINDTLLIYLEQEFGLALPELSLGAGDADEDAGDLGLGAANLGDFFKRFMTQVTPEVKAFQIDTSAVVAANFTYTKMPMVKELQNAAEQLAESDLVAAIAGDLDAAAAVRATQADVEITAPNYTPPEDEFLILPADASQMLAVNAAVAGETMIVHGPPGTGKSQTIANLITSLTARGRTVLFVAEKRAAIEAVAKRLREKGLGRLVLDLHGGVSRKKVAEQLKETLDAIQTVVEPSLGEEHRKLVRRRRELIAHVEALHEPREPWGISAYELQGQMLTLAERARTPVRLRGGQLAALDRVQIDELQDLAEEYTERGGFEVGSGKSAWARATLSTGEEAGEALGLVKELLGEVLPEACEAVNRLVEDAVLRPPESLEIWTELFEMFELLEAELARVQPSLLEADLTELEAGLALAERNAIARAFARLFNTPYRMALATARKHACEGVKFSGPDARTAVINARRLRELWGVYAPPDSTPSIPASYEDAHVAYETLHAKLNALGVFVPVDDDSVTDTHQLEERLRELIDDEATARALPRLRQIQAAFEEGGLGPLVRELVRIHADGPPVTPDEAVDAVAHVWLSSIYDSIAERGPGVGAFDGGVHERRVSEFRDLDARHIATTPKRVARRVAEHAVAVQDAHPDEDRLVRGQARRQRRHKAVRTLFDQAPRVLTAVKPCWAMSPLVVSEVLPVRQCFDYVIFDEASQVLPADAVPALARGGTAIIAGDDKQLPPTDFFTRTGGDEEDDEDDEALTVGYESVLDVVKALGVRERPLTTHYRSKDERLIAFSNAHFYYWSLATFPGVVGSECITHELVEFDASRPARNASNPPEVERVVELVLDHAATHPDRTLGVIAMGINHANVIQDALREAIPRDLDDFFSEDREERFFVKNLERVQGDERDSIILSIGYGKQADGRLLHRFGPLNNQGGERRLNVAVSRARERMTLVSAFSHHELDENRLNMDGAKLLRAYLEYAASGGLDLGTHAKEQPVLNPFERAIYERLQAAGIPVTPQFGSSGYRIDFVAGHPERPGELFFAIECDGASYHSSYVARERDRLRRETLERLGWIFHRIWSTDWFHDPAAETERTLRVWQEAAERFDERRMSEAVSRTESRSESAAGTVGEARGHSPGNPGSPAADPGPSVSTSDDVDPRRPGKARGPLPFRLTPRRPIDQYKRRQLIRLVRWVESDGLLRNRDQLFDEVYALLGYERRGSKIVERIYDAIDYVKKNR